MPRGFGVPLPSLICPRLLLVPASEPPLRFFEPSPLALSAASVPFGIGVEADSDVLSLTSGTFRMEISVGAAGGDDATEGGDCSTDLTGGS